MIVYLYLAIALVVGYLIGNINFARIFSWMFAKKDITTVGSKNPGTMNMLRTRGFGEAFLTLIMEAIKSGGPAIACYFLFEHYFVGFGNLAYFLAAFGAILGHCFPVFYKFKGGKGVLTSAGIILVINPITLLILLAEFLIAFGISKMVSLGSIVDAVSYPIVTYIVLRVTGEPALINTLFAALIGLIVLYLHRENIKRIIAGTEYKFGQKKEK